MLFIKDFLLPPLVFLNVLANKIIQGEYSINNLQKLNFSGDKKMSKVLTVELEDKTMEILELLMRKTGRTKEDLSEQAFYFLFEEMKEILLDT